MEENIKEKDLLQEFNITSKTSKNNVNYKKLVTKIIIDESNHLTIIIKKLI